MTVPPGWEVHRFGDAPTVVLHVPHAGLHIPAAVRSSLVLDDTALDAELAAMTDRHTDVLALGAAQAAHDAGVDSVVVVNRLSRLVVDPERLADDEESMAGIGMGRVYRATSALEPLRHPDPARDAALVAAYFEPYETAVATAVDEVLEANGSVTIVDVHSYPRDPLPYERDPDAERPGVCLGTHHPHSPEALVAAARDAFAGVPGGVAVDTPFAGVYVPTSHVGANPAVRALMVELRRDTYMDEDTLELHEGADGVSARIAALLRRC